uniref:Uncharacterized protein n=1 Tax=Amphimedon queenslandica TaxID=400682 RepID=A0A1X7TGJ6_AMPQE
MGKRKLCFDVRKNVERHKRQRVLQESSTEQSLILCNPIEVTHMNGQSLEPVTIDTFHTVTGQVLLDTIKPWSSLVVTIPLQLIFTLYVPNISLMKLIREPFGCQVTYVVGPGRIILSLSFHKMSDWFLFVITINHNFTWSLSVGSYQLTQYITESPEKLDQASVVLELLSHLDELPFCCGNSDQKFVNVKDARQGVFKSKN